MKSLTSTSSNNINTGSAQDLQRTNAGTLKVDKAGTLVIGALFSRTAFEFKENLDSERPQIVLHSEAPEFALMLNLLLIDGEFGVARFHLPSGRHLAALALENAHLGIWCVFDPYAAHGHQLLKDWSEHGDMHLALQGGSTEWRMRHPLTNSLINKILATPAPQDYQHNFSEDLTWMDWLAEGMCQDKPRLLVMLVPSVVVMP